MANILADINFAQQTNCHMRSLIFTKNIHLA